MSGEVDPVAARTRAVEVLTQVLDGRIADPVAFRSAWPPMPAPDALLRRAFFEGQHFFAVRGAALQRRVLAIVVRFLEEGGTPEAFSAAYDEAVRETGGCRCPD